MARGKQTCKILKDIRRHIAEANDIEFVTSECRYKGDCLGTCPKCEAEVHYLEQQLRKRQLAGKLVNLAGISAGSIAMLAPIAVQSQTPDIALNNEDITIHVPIDTLTVKGIARGEFTRQDGKIATDTLIGAVVRNLNTHKAVSTNIDGEFAIEASIGDSIEASYVGFNKQTLVVSGNGPLVFTLNDKGVAILGEMPVSRGYVPEPVDRENTLDLYVVDKNKETLPNDKVTIERVYIDEDGDEDAEELSPSWLDDKGVLRIYWNDDWALKDEEDKPLKEATLRITAEGYAHPVTIKVKYPKHHDKKTIRFKHSR